jgi:hypothetical protein
MPEVIRRMRVKLVVVGECYGDEDEYRKKIKQLNIGGAVDFRAEYVSPEDVNMYFSATDLVVLPYESATQSGIVQIAYQFDKPVIATGVGGLAEVVVDGKTGFIVKPGDPKALANAIVKYFQDRLEGHFVRGIHEEKRKYSWDHLTKAIIELGRAPFDAGRKGGAPQKDERGVRGRSGEGRGNDRRGWQRGSGAPRGQGHPRSQTQPREQGHPRQQPQPPTLGPSTPQNPAAPKGPPKREGGGGGRRRRGWRGGRGGGRRKEGGGESAL